ncbi:hypothetical protein K435DRAFT_617871, partial [Dendrothele bispora CBS 962.96]
VPKPHGENGRPGRGGYALKDVLGWDKDEYKKVQVRFYTQGCAYWNSERTNFRISSKILLKRNLSLETKFPKLRNYQDNWATDEFIKSALKYRQTRTKIH